MVEFIDMFKIGDRVKICKDNKHTHTAYENSLIGKEGIVVSRCLGVGSYKTHYYYSIKLNEGHTVNGVHQAMIKR